MGDAVLLERLRRGHLVVAAEHELLVDDVEDRIRAPAELVGHAAACGSAAAPLVREHDLRAVVRERRPVPVRVVRVGDGVDPLRVGGIADVDQQAVALAGPGGQPDLRIGRDVVARIRDRRRAPVHPRRMLRRRRSVLQAVHRTGDRIGEEPRLGHDRGGLRRRQRNLDHFDAVERAVRVRGACVDAARHLGRGANAAGPGHVDVEVVRCRSGSSAACAYASRDTSAPPRPGRARRGSRCRRSERRGSAAGRRSGPPGRRSRCGPVVSSADMKSRFPYTETSPCPPGQTTAVRI